jgi:hypothetical protein
MVHVLNFEVICDKWRDDSKWVRNYLQNWYKVIVSQIRCVKREKQCNKKENFMISDKIYCCICTDNNPTTSAVCYKILVLDLFSFNLSWNVKLRYKLNLHSTHKFGNGFKLSYGSRNDTAKNDTETHFPIQWQGQLCEFQTTEYQYLISWNS